MSDITPVPGTMVTLTIPVCTDCKHYLETQVFDLCMHEHSKYWIADRVDQHSVGHMRWRGACGDDAKLFDPRVLT